MIRYLAPVLLAPALAAQFVYDFNSLNGSDQHPFTLLDGQDNWSEQTFNANNRCGVTQTLSHDGTPALRFQESGPGFGCDASRINDGNWLFAPFSGGETHAKFQVDIRVGYWGGSFGLAHDTNGDSIIRGSQPGERGVRFLVGSQPNQQLRLYAADQTFAQVPLSSIGAGGGDWLRVSVVMDFTAAAGAGAGSVFVQNLTLGEQGLRTVAGLQGVPLGLDQSAVDATNPLLWDAMWLHFEGATYELDNIDVGSGGYAIPFGAACPAPYGTPELVANGPFTIGTPVVFESGNHEANAVGLTIFGFSTTSHLGLALPLSLDPILGTSGCALYTDIVVAALAVTGATAPATMSQAFGIPPAVWTGFAFNVQQGCLESANNWSFTNALQVQFP